jgi:hypothetical protein
MDSGVPQLTLESLQAPPIAGDCDLAFSFLLSEWDGSMEATDSRIPQEATGHIPYEQEEQDHTSQEPGEQEHTPPEWERPMQVYFDS